MLLFQLFHFLLGLCLEILKLLLGNLHLFDFGIVLCDASFHLLYLSLPMYLRLLLLFLELDLLGFYPFDLFRSSLSGGFLFLLEEHLLGFLLLLQPGTFGPDRFLLLLQGSLSLLFLPFLLFHLQSGLLSSLLLLFLLFLDAFLLLPLLPLELSLGPLGCDSGFLSLPLSLYSLLRSDPLFLLAVGFGLGLCLFELFLSLDSGLLHLFELCLFDLRLQGSLLLLLLNLQTFFLCSFFGLESLLFGFFHLLLFSQQLSLKLVGLFFLSPGLFFILFPLGLHLLLFLPLFLGESSLCFLLLLPRLGFLGLFLGSVFLLQFFLLPLGLFSCSLELLLLFFLDGLFSCLLYLLCLLQLSSSVNHLRLTRNMDLLARLCRSSRNTRSVRLGRDCARWL